MSGIVDVLHFQRLLRCSGFDPGPLDGQMGPKTLAAAAAFQEMCAKIALEAGAVDPRSEKAIATLLPATQRAARRFLRECALHGMDVRVISGTRTYAEQDEIYAQGRTKKPGPIVTRARGGQSNHNFGLAFDVGVFEGGKYLPDGSEYSMIATLRPPGVEWGGDWPMSLGGPDRPHYQMATGFSLGEVRRRFEAGLLRVEGR